LEASTEFWVISLKYAAERMRRNVLKSRMMKISKLGLKKLIAKNDLDKVIEDMFSLFTHYQQFSL
jgi:hypothetical protein